MKISPVKIKHRLQAICVETDQRYDRVQTLFLLECAAIRLSSDTELSKHLVFKGGFVSVKVYNSARFTTDLDAVALGISKTLAEKKILNAMLEPSDDGVWFSFDSMEDTAHQGDYGGSRFIFRSGVGKKPAKLTKTQIVNIDIGIGDAVTPGPKFVETPAAMPDIRLRWQVYPPETIVSEKLHALITLGSLNSRSKDIYDIYLLIPRVDITLLEAALSATFAFRRTTLPKSVYEIVSTINRATLRRGWKSSVGSMTAPPDFDETFDAVAAWLKAKNI